MTRQTAAPAAKKRGAPKKQPSIGFWRGKPDPENSADRKMAEDLEIYKHVKAAQATGASREDAIGAAMERFQYSDRRSIQRKIAPFIKAEYFASKFQSDLQKSAAHQLEKEKSQQAFYAAAGAQLNAARARLALVFNPKELREIENLTMPFALELADGREQLSRYRRLYHKRNRKSAANK